MKNNNFFADFFYGNLEPQALPLPENPKLKQHFDELCRIEIEFKKLLNTEEQELFDKYVEAYNNFNDVLGFLMFKKGFS